MTRKYIIIPEYAPLYAFRAAFGPAHGPLTKPTPCPIDVIGKLFLQSGKEKVTIYEVVPEGKGFSEPIQLTKENYRLPYAEIVERNKKPLADGMLQNMDPEEKPQPVMPVIIKTEVPVHHGDTGVSTPEAAKEMLEKMEQAPEMPVEPAAEEVPETPVVETTSEDEITEPVSEDMVEESVEDVKPVEDETPAEVIPSEEISESEPVIAEPDVPVEEKLEEAETTGEVTPADEIDWSKLTKAERKRLRRELGLNGQNQPIEQ